MFHICSFFQGPRLISFVRCSMRNLAKYIAGLGFLLRKKGGLNCFTFSSKGCFDCDSIGDVFHFFCDQNRRFLRGDGGSLPGPHSLWLTRFAEVVMIATKNLMSDSREL